jgi:hypothetical protein
MLNTIRFAGRRIRDIDRNNLREDQKIYDQYLEDRNIIRTRHYLTPTFFLNSPTVRQLARMNLIGHTWSTGDKYYKLADQYYEDPRYWWIIAWVNRAPTEAHLKIGDFIHIPTPLEDVLVYL